MTDPQDAPAGRVPLPVDATLQRLKLSAVDAPLEEALDRVITNRRVLDEFKPIDESLESELSNLCWQRSGLLLFVENDVPYAINNNSLLSDRAGGLLFRSCLESPPDESIRILELGAGTGLFARFLLDAFRAKCVAEGRDFYRRLTFYVTDRSPATVRQWAERGVFAGHEGHAVTAVCNALEPFECTPEGSAAVKLGGLRAVFCNYLFDTLPSKVVRRGEQGCEELHVRTHLTDDAARVKHLTNLTVDEIRAMARSNDASERAQLVPLVSLFEFETAFRHNGHLPAFAEEALALGAGLDRVVVNHGALQCIDACATLLAENGFLLASDYGPVHADQISAQAVTQRFGRTTALGVNFPLIQHHAAKQGWTVIKPEEDDARPIHTRLILKTRLPGLVESFQHEFSLEEHLRSERIPEEARRHIEAGRLDEAMACYKQGLARHPRDWRLLGELAEFLVRNLADYAAGAAAASAAVRLNPWYSAWLWNIVGDALYAQDRFEEAHESYMQGYRIDPNDVRTNLNLGYTYAAAGRYGEALAAIARGLAADNGMFRDRLLEKQQTILGALSAKLSAEGEWLNRRATRLRP